MIWDITEILSINRRHFLKTTAASAASLALSKGVALGAEDSLKIGFISPRTGPLAAFGETDGYVLEKVRETLAAQMTLGGKQYSIEIIDRDSQSDPSRAGQLAKDLINQDQVDMMLAISTPEVVNPVSDVCEAAGVPSLSGVVPWEAWYFGRGAKPGKPSPFKWSHHFCFGMGETASMFLSHWDMMDTNKKVGVMYPNDADGHASRNILAPILEQGGYTIVDPGPYENGTVDFSTQIALFKREGIEIFNSLPIPPDFASFWRQAAQQGLTRQIKVCQVGKACLFPAELEALGSLGKNIASGLYWHPAFPYASSLTGITGPQLANGYQDVNSKQWTQQLGATMSLFDAAFAALDRSDDPKDKAALASTLSTLKVDTMVGTVDFTSGPVGNVATAPLIGGQWVPSSDSRFVYELAATENQGDPNVPLTAELQLYNT